MSTNDITGDRLISKTSTEAYRDRYDAIFKKKPVTQEAEKVEQDDASSQNSHNNVGIETT